MPKNSQIDCAAAFPGELSGETSWIIPKGKSKNKWIELKFKTAYQVLKFDYKPIKNQLNNIKQLKVIFDDLQFQIFHLIKLDSVQTFTFDSKQTKKVTFQIHETYANELDTGGSFHVHGLQCEKLEEPTPLDPKEVVPVGCGESMFNHPVLSDQKLEPGTSYNINCLSGCFGEANKLFGKTTYEQTSLLCVGCAHSGAIDVKTGGKCKVALVEALKNFEAFTSNTILSASKISKYHFEQIAKLFMSKFKNARIIF